MADNWKKLLAGRDILRRNMPSRMEGATRTLLAVMFVSYAVSIGGTEPVDIVLSPSGDIEAMPGSTVIVNCSRTGIERPNIRWRLPWNNIKLPSEYPITKDGTTRGRFSNIWTERHSVLQLVIARVRFDDAGTYTCEYDDNSDSPRRTFKSVRIAVLNQANASSCTRHQYRCPGTEICIPLRFICDHLPDCPNHGDELNCPVESCKGKFQCRNGKCIELSKRCDVWKIFDCRDQSDEDNCPNRITYTGQIKPEAGDSASMQSMDSHPSHNSWHFNAIYSGVAAVVGLVCVVAVVTVTVCRIHMRREALRQMLNTNQDQSNRRRHRQNRNNSRPAWQQSTPPTYDPAAAVEDYIPPHRLPPNTNVAVNINVQFTPNRTPEFTSLLVTPPPYKEREEPSEGTPPPPYSTLPRGSGESSPPHPGPSQVSEEAAVGLLRPETAMPPVSPDGPPGLPPSHRDVETGQAQENIRSGLGREQSDLSGEHERLLAEETLPSQTTQSAV